MILVAQFPVYKKAVLRTLSNCGEPARARQQIMTDEACQLLPRAVRIADLGPEIFHASSKRQRLETERWRPIIKEVASTRNELQ